MADPLCSWELEDVLRMNCGGADNDIYGKLFYYVKNQFAKFIQRLRILKLRVDVTTHAAEELHNVADIKNKSFDRIFVSQASYSHRASLTLLGVHPGREPVFGSLADNGLLSTSTQSHAHKSTCHSDIAIYTPTVRLSNYKALSAVSAQARGIGK